MKQFFQEFARLNHIISEQGKLFQDFIGVLNQEENSISEYSLTFIEETLIKKDQIVKIAQAMEERRCEVTERLFHMMAFDSRKTAPSLATMNTVLNSYCENVKTLLSKEQREELSILCQTFHKKSQELKNTFQIFSERSYRNKLILSKLTKHVSLSLQLFEVESAKDNCYDPSGKNYSSLSALRPSSILSVKV